MTTMRINDNIDKNKVIKEGTFVKNGNLVYLLTNIDNVGFVFIDIESGFQGHFKPRQTIDEINKLIEETRLVVLYDVELNLIR